ncbi:MAG: hypothetical protein ACOH1U_01150 [Rhodoglobus sp.]
MFLLAAALGRACGIATVNAASVRVFGDPDHTQPNAAHKVSDANPRVGMEREVENDQQPREWAEETAGRKAFHWNRNMRAVEIFAAATGSLPRDSRARRADPATSVERQLARFLRYQRHNELHLTPSQQERLERLAGFEWAPMETAWECRRQDYLTFIRTRGRIPRRRSSDPRERQLELWFHRQALRLRRGLMPHHLRAAFSELIESVHGVDKPD